MRQRQITTYNIATKMCHSYQLRVLSKTRTLKKINVGEKGNFINKFLLSENGNCKQRGADEKL